jgi:hypothetical protein
VEMEPSKIVTETPWRSLVKVGHAHAHTHTCMHTYTHVDSRHTFTLARWHVCAMYGMDDRPAVGTRRHGHARNAKTHADARTHACIHAHTHQACSWRFVAALITASTSLFFSGE